MRLSDWIASDIEETELTNYVEDDVKDEREGVEDDEDNVFPKFNDNGPSGHGQGPGQYGGPDYMSDNDHNANVKWDLQAGSTG